MRQSFEWEEAARQQSPQAYDLLAEIYDAFQEGELLEALLEEESSLLLQFLQEQEEQGFFPSQVNSLQASTHQANSPQTAAVVDLGCGTGSFTLALAELLWQEGKSLPIIGLECSFAMLEKARGKSRQLPFPAPEWRLGDLQDQRLYPSSVRLFFSSLDSLNHLRKEELRELLPQLYAHLETGGLLFFDFLTPAYMEENFAARSYQARFASCQLKWSNAYQPERRQNWAHIRLLPGKQKEGGQARGEPSIKTYELDIWEQAYDLAEMEELLTQAGFEELAFAESCQEGRFYALAKKLPSPQPTEHEHDE